MGSVYFMVLFLPGCYDVIFIHTSDSPVLIFQLCNMSFLELGGVFHLVGFS